MRCTACGYDDTLEPCGCDCGSVNEGASVEDYYSVVCPRCDGSGFALAGPDADPFIPVVVQIPEKAFIPGGAADVVFVAPTANLVACPRCKTVRLKE